MDNLFFFSKISTGSGCLCLWVPRGLGESWTNQLRTTLILPLASRQQWAVRERHQRLLTHPLPNYGSRLTCTAHSDPSSVRHGPGPCIPPRCPTAGTSVVPMVPLVRCLGAGSCPAVLLAPKDHLTGLCDSVRPASSQVQGHPPHSSEGSRCP